MKTYDLIIIGTGSAMNMVQPFLDQKPNARIAIIDKDPPGGICLTKGCIPTKILVYPADLLRELEAADRLGIELKVRKIDFKKIMKRMRGLVQPEIENIRTGLLEDDKLDYYPVVAEFVGPNQLMAGGDLITSKMIFLCLGSRPLIPPITGLNSGNYFTSDTILELEELPRHIVIIGGGYIAAEYGHFFSAMNSKVTIIGRNPRFLPEEEPEISDLAQKIMSKNMNIMTGCAVKAVEENSPAGWKIIFREQKTGKEKQLNADILLVAAGRTANTDLLHPEQGGIETDENGWIRVNAYLETTAANVWSFGDAIGKHMFKHVANYESKIVYYNAVLKKKVKVDYRAVPHAVFSFPEVAAVGLTEKQAVDIYGKDGFLIGFQRYQDTARGEAMDVEDYFVKAIVERESGRILGTHIIGPQASILIQEIITLLYTDNPTLTPVVNGMHIHPALGEVVERAFMALMPPEEYHQMLEGGWL
jgi:dihydrolipoamide dehydrogenase